MPAASPRGHIEADCSSAHVPEDAPCAKRQRNVFQLDDGFCHDGIVLIWKVAEDRRHKPFSSYGLSRMAFKRRFRMPSACVPRRFLGARLRRRAPSPRKIVGFGDSLMAGYGLDAGQGFTDKLESGTRGQGSRCA